MGVENEDALCRPLEKCLEFQYLSYMAKNTPISLGEYYEEFIAQQLASGSFKNASEVVQEGLRLLEEREDKMNNLKIALNEGIQSGVVANFDPEEFINELHLSKEK